MGKPKEKKQKKKSSPTRVDGELINHSIPDSAVGPSNLNNVMVIELNPSKKPTMGEGKVTEPSKTLEHGSSSKPPIRDSNSRDVEPVPKAIQSYAETASRPITEEKERTNMEQLKNPEQRPTGSRLVDLRDQLFWAAKCYGNMIEHMTNLDTTGLVGIIEENMSNFDKRERAGPMTRSVDEARVTKEFFLEKKVAELEVQLTEITAHNQEISNKYRQALQKNEQLREQGESRAYQQQEKAVKLQLELEQKKA